MKTQIGGRYMAPVTSKIEFSTTIVNGIQSLTIFIKSSVPDDAVVQDLPQRVTH